MTLERAAASRSCSIQCTARWKNRLLFDAVDWAASRASAACKKLSGCVLAWLGLSGRGADLHIAQLMPLPLTISCCSKSRLILPFWYRLTRVVPDKGPLPPLNGCCILFLLCIRQYLCNQISFIFENKFTRREVIRIYLNLTLSNTVLVGLCRTLPSNGCNIVQSEK